MAKNVVSKDLTYYDWPDGSTRSRPDTFYTDFSATENPLSEGGLWSNRNPYFTQVQTASGYAKSTGTGNPGNGTYLDSYAICNLGFGPDQYVAGTIRKASPTGSREVELLLRFKEINNSGVWCPRGYEVYIAHDGAYLNITRWSGSPMAGPATITYFEVYEGGATTTPADGDVFSAQIVGTTITVKLNASTLLTYDVSDFTGSVFADGQPGMGFDFNTGDSAADTYCFSDFTAEAL